MKPTILFICPDFLMGGSTRSLMNLIESVHDRVNAIVLLPSKGAAYDWFVEHNVECIVHQYAILHLMTNPNWKNVVFHPWRMPIIKYIRYEWSCVFCVLRYLNGRRIDIVHSNVSPIAIGTKLALFLGAKHIWHIREYVDLDFHKEIFGGRSRLIRKINSANGRIAISNMLKKHWQLKDKNTWVLPNPICRKSDRCYNPQKQPYILFCSYYVTESKGASWTVHAFGKSKVYEDGISLKIVGNCNEEYKETLQKIAENYSCEQYVDFCTCQSNTKDFFANAMAFVMASENEGFGRTTAEAMFYGCPVLARASGGTLELVRDGETGYLFRTIEEAAILLRKVCSDNQEKIILQAQEFALKNLSQEVYRPKILAVYRDLLQ